MNRFYSLFFLIALLLAPFGEALADERAKISKVNYHFLTKDAQNQEAEDPMVGFERRHLLHGALYLSEQRARYGSYYSIFWETDDRSRPVTVRFEYRLEKSAATVKVRETEVLDIKRKNVSKFSVIGDEFQTNGKVVAWRASVIRDDQVLATHKSFLWD